MTGAKGTGWIFKPKGSRFYWVACVSGAKRRFEGTKSERKIDAQELLTQLLGEAGAATAHPRVFLEFLGS